MFLSNRITQYGSNFHYCKYDTTISKRKYKYKTIVIKATLPLPTAKFLDIMTSKGLFLFSLVTFLTKVSCSPLPNPEGMQIKLAASFSAIKGFSCM